MSQLFYLPQQPVLNETALPVAGALAYFYVTGTTTLAPIYADAGLTTPLNNPVTADAFGRLVPIYLDGAIVYRLRVTRPNGAIIGADIDPYVPTSNAASGGQFVE